MNIQQTASPQEIELATPGMHTVEVTPALAYEWLVANTSNRTLKPAAVAALVADISAGDWRFTGEAIKFDSTGALLDGQHRLNAIFEAGLPIVTLVVTGLDPSSQEAMDTGSKRSLADVLKLRSEAIPKSLAATIAATYEWESGRLGSASRSVGGGSATTNAIYSRWLEAHPELRAAASSGDSYYNRGAKSLGLTRKQCSLLVWILDRVSIDDRTDFFEKVVTGFGLDEGSPIAALRSNLMKDVTSTRRLPPDHRVAQAIKAWNAYRLGARIKRLSYTPGGASGEKFPVPQ